MGSGASERANERALEQRLSLSGRAHLKRLLAMGKGAWLNT